MKSIRRVRGLAWAYQIRKALFSAVAAMTVISPIGAAEAEGEGETFNLATMTCWDLTGVEQEAQVPALMMVYGYVAGINDMKEQVGTEIGPALERVGQLCTANPDMYVASAISRVLQVER